PSKITGLQQKSANWISRESVHAKRHNQDIGRIICDSIQYVEKSRLVCIPICASRHRNIDVQSFSWSLSNLISKPREVRKCKPRVCVNRAKESTLVKENVLGTVAMVIIYID